jgi:hypothetical protein
LKAVLRINSPLPLVRVFSKALLHAENPRKQAKRRIRPDDFLIGAQRYDNMCEFFKKMKCLIWLTVNFQQPAKDAYETLKVV